MISELAENQKTIYMILKMTDHVSAAEPNKKQTVDVVIIVISHRFPLLLF